jgi:hypothetical protein
VKTTTATPLVCPPGPSRKLAQAQTAATVIAPFWPWYHAFARLATETLHFPAARDLFFPGRLGKPEGVGPPAWSIVAFRL